MILLLPLFPSQDGPIHLYYVDVLRNLLAHTGPYAQYFEVKSYLTPYMLEYYALLGLEQFFSPFVSEEMLISTYVLMFILSFRYLLRSVTEYPTPWALVGALFCLNIYVYMGFLNYAIGTALVLLLSGCWLRWMRQLTVRRIAALGGGFILLVFTHPLPPAAFLSFAGVYLAVSFISEWNSDPSARKRTLHSFGRPLAALAFMGVVASIWIIHFTNDSKPVPKGTDAGKTLSLFYRIVIELVFFRTIPIHIGMLRFALTFLILSIAIALIIALVRHKCYGAIPLSLTIFTTICFILSSAAPDKFRNAGANFFSTRFSVFWIVFLITAAASVKPSRRFSTWIGIAAFAIAAVILPMHWIYLSRTARDMNVALNVPLVKPGSMGMLIADKDALANDNDNEIEIVKPYMWTGVHFFRESQAILTNAPWMDFKYIMLRPKIVDPWTYEDDLRYVPTEALDALNSDSRISVDFVGRFGPDGRHTSAVIQRLGLPLIGESPNLTFYARPSALRPRSAQSRSGSNNIALTAQK
jgi:hypothetical protein